MRAVKADQRTTWLDRLPVTRVIRDRDQIEQVRLAFVVLAVINVVVQAVPVTLAVHDHPVPIAVALAGAAVPVAVWCGGLRRHDFGPVATVLELAGLFVFGLDMGQPARLLNPLYAALYLHCLYGTHRGAVARAFGYVAVLAGVAAVQSPADHMQQTGPLVAWTLPSLLVTATVMRLLVVSLARLSLARDTSAQLAHTASQLLLANDPLTVARLAESGVRGVVPDAREVRLDLSGTGPATERDGRLDLNLAEGDRLRGRLSVLPSRPLSRQQEQGIRTIAAQATAALRATALRAELHHRANHDALTELPNRALFGEALTAALARPTGTAAVLFIDVDDFKMVNDSLGHAAGDRLLVEVANRLAGCLRDGELAARIGGDEFAVLLRDVADIDAAIASARRLLVALDEPLDLDGRLFHPHSSIGIALGDSDPDFPEPLASGLLRRADIAMYVAKARGKNRYEVFGDAMADALVHQRSIRERLSTGLARGEFRLLFQPIVDLATGRVESVESLLRWYHPTIGMVSPDEFVPHAEQVGLLADLERWVIAEACRVAAGWPGPDAPSVAVNISPRHLYQNWLVPTVTQALHDTGLPAHRLIIEVTEESMIVDPTTALENLRACIALGAQISMDDFGAGHASLRHLTGLPVDIVKIDRELLWEETGPVVVRAVVDLVHALGRRVVVEGVEDSVQLRWLRESGCDAVQGYLLSRPVPADVLRFKFDLDEILREAATEAGTGVPTR